MRSPYDPLENGIGILRDITGPLDVSDKLEDKAIAVFKQVLNETDAPHSGLSTETTVAACLVLAARSSSDLYTAEGVAPFASDSVDTTAIYRATRYILKEIDVQDESMMFHDPHKYVDDIGRVLDVDPDDTERAHELVSILQNEGAAVGKKAGTVAAAVIYLLGLLRCDKHRESAYIQKDIAQVACVSTVTIRNTYPTFAQTLHSHPDADDEFTDFWWL